MAEDVDIKVMMWQEGTEVEFGEGGKIVSPVKEGPLKLDVSLYTEGYVAFIVDGAKNITVCRNVSEEPSQSRHILSVPVKRRQGDLSTAYPQNHLKVLQVVDERRGLFAVIEIAIVSQRGHHWGTVQETWRTRFHCAADGHLHEPQFPDWSQGQEFFRDYMPNVTDPCKEEWKELEVDMDGVTAQTGRVIWFNQAQQMGAIRLAGQYEDGRDRVIRVHWRELGVAESGDRNYLEVEQLVNVWGLKKPHMREGRTTVFREEASGVTLA